MRVKFVEAMLREGIYGAYYLDGDSGAGSLTSELCRSGFLIGDLVAVVKLDDLNALIAKAAALDNATSMHVHTAACFQSANPLAVTCGIGQGDRISA